MSEHSHLEHRGRKDENGSRYLETRTVFPLRGPHTRDTVHDMARNTRAREPINEPLEGDDDEREPNGLEIFDDAGDELTWYFYRLADAGQREDQRHGYVLKIIGRVDPDDLRRELGGGLYRALAREGRQLVKTMRIRIAGAPKDVPASTSTAAGAGAAPAPSPVEARLERLEAAITNLARTPQPSPLELVQLLSAMRQTETNAGLVPAMLGMFEKGAALAAAATGKNGSGETADIIREAVNGVALFMGRQSNPPAAPAATGPGDATDDFVRLLMRARASGRTPDEAADGADAVLSDLDLSRLRALPDASVMVVIRGRSGLAGAELAGLENYTAAFLAALRAPSQAEVEAG